jgi:hypothetical protein
MTAFGGYRLGVGFHLETPMPTKRLILILEVTAAALTALAGLVQLIALLAERI